ncbi:MAG: DUF255 domain-containing protein [Deltaproteobacteria bacterium]|nr:MAG: DUF255 domain-containing protein [Deltaproteobacteria bacterium]
MNLKKLLIFLIIISSLSPVKLFSQAQDPFQWFFDGETREINPEDKIPLQVEFIIPPGHILYKEKFSISLLKGDGYELGLMELPPAIRKQDPITGADEEVYVDGVALKSVLIPKNGFKPLESEASIKFQVTYQGCSEKLCFKPTKKEILLPIEYKGVSSGFGHFHFNTDFSSTNFFLGKGLLTLLLMTFLGGLLSDFTPCVLPIIPITLAFIGIKRSDHRHWHNFLHTLVLVLAMAISYSFLGVVVALLGKSLGFLFQSIYFLFFAIALYVFFAFSMFGFYEIQLPLMVRNKLAKWGGQGYVGSMLSGITVGLLAAPCVGPLIGSLLIYVAQERDLMKGFLLLFSYGLGMGSLFLVVGTYYHRLAPKVHGGPFTVWIKNAFGIILLIPAFYYGSIAWAHIKNPSAKVTSQKIWTVDDSKGFEKALKENKLIFMDFYADWCLPCLEMEKKTFSDSEVQKFLSDNFVPIKINCTEETPQCNKLVDRYQVIGWPTMLILDSKGNIKQKYVGENWGPDEFFGKC